MISHSFSDSSSFKCGCDLRTARSNSEAVIAEARERANVSTRKPDIGRFSVFIFKGFFSPEGPLCKFSLSAMLSGLLIPLLWIEECFLDRQGLFAKQVFLFALTDQVVDFVEILEDPMGRNTGDGGAPLCFFLVAGSGLDVTERCLI